MGRIERGFRLARASLEMLRSDKQLMVLPVLSTAAILVFAGAVLSPLFVSGFTTGGHNRAELYRLVAVTRRGRAPDPKGHPETHGPAHAGTWAAVGFGGTGPAGSTNRLPPPAELASPCAVRTSSGCRSPANTAPKPSFDSIPRRADT